MRGLNFAPLLLVVALGACAPASRQSPEIAAQAERWEAALNAGDVDALVAMYTEDARLMPPNAQLGEGRAAARAAFGEMIATGLKADLEVTEAVAAGDIGYEVGVYSLSGPDGAFVDRGKYIAVWRQVAGEWQIANDIWNSDIRAAWSGATLLVTHEVADPARWQAAWQGAGSRHELFSQHGAPNVRTYQSRTNPRLTGLLIDVTDMNAFQAFMDSPLAATAKSQDGVRDPTLRVFAEMK